MVKDNIVIQTCEVSFDPETTFELGRDWGVKNFELREVFSPGTRVPYFNLREQEHLRFNLKRYGAKIVTISPGLFIGAEANEDNARREFKEKLPRCLHFCEQFGVTNMIVFSFKKTKGVSIEWVIDKLGQITQIAEREGITFYLEPLIDHYADDGDSMSKIIKGIASRNLQVNWDPSNIYFAGTIPYPEQFEYVKDFVGYVHLKDCAKMASEKSEECPWRLLGEGEVNCKEQLRTLKNIGYSGYLCIETHTFYNKVKTTKKNLDTLIKWISKM